MSQINITYSSEMMTNYLQAELISPQKKFEALQVNSGESLLFSIGTDGIFYVIEEKSGKTQTGWTKADLSSAQIMKDFAGSKDIACKTFSTGQSVQDGSIGLAMVIESDGIDKLYLSLANSNKDTSWISSPHWMCFDYDDTAHSLSKIEIVNVFFCETTGHTQYIIVDVLRDPSAAIKDIVRYFIDPDKTNGTYWNLHDLPIDIEENKYQSCLGRAVKGYVDGLYTFGEVGTSNQFIFVPIINVFGEGAPTPVRLSLPDGASSEAMASVRNADLSTDLFVVSGTSLYYFAASNQQDGAVATRLLSNDIFSDTNELFAMSLHGAVVLWGKNNNDEVYYISCLQNRMSESGAWSVPVPILSGIEKISPFINIANGGNTVFASSEGQLQKITQSSFSTSKLWHTHLVTLPAAPTGKALSFISYTTTIQVTDEHDLPLQNASLSIKSNNPCSVYINGIFYILDRIPVHIQANALGLITIVEATHTLSGTTFTLSAGNGTSVTINPMKKVFKKLASLGDNNGDTGKLNNAVINTGNGQTKSLVAMEIPANDRTSVSRGLASLDASYEMANFKLNRTGPLTATLDLTRPFVQSAVGSFGDDLMIAAGDLFKWLESGIETIIEVVKDAASEMWYFVVKIAGKVYRAVLDSIEAVADAAVWLFDTIKTGIEDVIKYVEFLFEWDDIQRTKEVIHNLTKRFLECQVANIKVAKKDFDTMIGEVETAVNQWAGLTDWSGLGEVATQPVKGNASNPMKEQTAGSLHLVHHFQNNAGSISIVGNAPKQDVLQSLIDESFTALQNQAVVFDPLMDQLAELATEFSGLTVEEVLKRFIGIIVDGVLSGTQAIVDVLFDILSNMADSILSILDTKIHIPVISDILKEIGIQEISFLDLFCWISAVAYTVVYKIAKGVAPFPDNDESRFLINVTSIDQLKAAFVPQLNMLKAERSVAPTAAATSDTTIKGSMTMSDSTKQTVYIAGHSIAGFCTLMNGFVSNFEVLEPTGNNPFSIPSAVLAVMSGAFSGLTNILVPKYPIKNKAVSIIDGTTLGIRILCKVFFSNIFQKKFQSATGVMRHLSVNNNRATGAIFDAVLIVPACVCTVYHFVELSSKTAEKAKTDAIIDEVSKLASYIARMSYTLAVNDRNPESKTVEIVVMDIANVTCAGLQTAEAIEY